MKARSLLANPSLAAIMGLLSGMGVSLSLSSAAHAPSVLAQANLASGVMPQAGSVAQATLASVESLSLSAADQQVFQQVMPGAIAQRQSGRSLGQILQTLAEQFLGAPYVAGLLDQSTSEKLVLSLQDFDCVLFVESILGLAKTAMAADPTPQTFAQQVQNLRYRHGEVNGYCSRLHYFSDWIVDNQRKGLVMDLSAQLGSIPLNKTLNFMSSHRQSYPQLMASDRDYQCIVETESKLNQETLYYIPTEQIAGIYSQLQPGDIVAIATAVPGLDVTHTGLVYPMPDGNIGLIHAAPNRGVIIAGDLQSYVSRVEEAIGIMVARPLDN